MATFYSKSTRGFYKSDIHKEIPEDAIEITEDHYKNLLEEQSKGKIIDINSKGKPVAKIISPQVLQKRRALLSDLVSLLISKGIIDKNEISKDLNWRMDNTKEEVKENIKEEVKEEVKEKKK